MLSELWDSLQRLRRSPNLLKRVFEAFSEHELTLATTGIAFRMALAAVPALLVAVAVLGFFDLEELWRTEVVPSLRENVSQPIFEAINTAVLKVLRRQELFWLTIGLALAIWQVGSIARAVARVIHRVNGHTERRSTVRRIIASIPVGAAAMAAMVAGILAIELVEVLITRADVGTVVEVAVTPVRVVAGLLLMLIAVGIVHRYSTDLDRPPALLSLGNVVTVLGWVVGTILVGLYLEHFASYSSTFGNLATAFILLEYVALLAYVWTAGIVLDALVNSEGRRPRVAGS